MDWTAFFSGATGAGVLAVIIKLIDVYSGRNKTRADAAKTIVEGGAQAVKMMQDLLTEYDRTNDQQRVEIEKLKKDAAEAAKGREKRLKRIEELEQKNSDLEAYAIKLDNQIRADVTETEALRKKVVEMEQKYGRMKRINEKLVKALQDAEIPLPDLNGDMTDSVVGLKWEKKP